MKYRFYQVNVFSNVPFGGNQLAVFSNAKGLTSTKMQKIAKEMNMSETVFIRPSKKISVDYYIRIFTPEKELPFAGHPIIGTAHILREIGEVPSGDYVIKLGMKAGTISISQKQPSYLFMSQLLPKYKIPLNSTKKISNVLGITNKHTSSNSLPIQIVSTGLPVLIVPISTLNELKKIKVDQNKLRQILAKLGTDIIYTFTLKKVYSKVVIYSRAFAPGLGISEDPATGSAAGALASYLYKHNQISHNDCRNIKIKQGYEMKRPSTIHVKIEQENKKIRSIHVGGQSKIVVEGLLSI